MATALSPPSPAQFMCNRGGNPTMKNRRSNESCQRQKQSINQVHRVNIRCRRPTISRILLIIRCAIIVKLYISVIMGGKSKIFDLKRAGLTMSENCVPFNRQRQYTIWWEFQKYIPNLSDSLIRIRRLTGSHCNDYIGWRQRRNDARCCSFFKTRFWCAIPTLEETFFAVLETNCCNSKFSQLLDAFVAHQHE